MVRIWFGEGLVAGNSLPLGFSEGVRGKLVRDELVRVEDAAEVEEDWRLGSESDVLLVGVFIGVGLLIAVVLGV